MNYSMFKIFKLYIFYIKKYIGNRKKLANIIKDLPLYFYFNLQNKNPIDLKLPWLSIGSYRLLKDIVNKDMKVFEYGSGGSTLFFADKVKEVVSVEHDESWFNFVKIRIRENNLKNINISLVKPSNSSLGNNDFVSNTKKSEFVGFHFFEYVSHIDVYENNYFDIILIDGRCRNKCLEYSLNKLKKGGYIILDNSDRKEYLIAKSKLKNWKHIEKSGLTVCDLFESTTSIYIKP